MPKNSIKLHRVVKSTPEKIYRAFVSPEALSFWLPPFGFLCTIQEFNPKVGGHFKMTFINFSTGNKSSFGGTFINMDPCKSLTYTDTFDDAHLPGKMTTSVVMKQVSCGTDLEITQKNIPVGIPAEMCYLGWQESLEKLIKLVEPEIPNA